ncbi:hypothetical protein F220043C3_37920 [Enterocloster asparagiformis]
MPEECNREGASPIESAAAQDWAKGTLRSWYVEPRPVLRAGALIVGIHAAHVTCQEWGAGQPEPNAGGTAGILECLKKRQDPVPEYDFVCIPGRDFLMRGTPRRTPGAAYSPTRNPYRKPIHLYAEMR